MRLPMIAETVNRTVQLVLKVAGMRGGHRASRSAAAHRRDLIDRRVRLNYVAVTVGGDLNAARGRSHDIAIRRSRMSAGAGLTLLMVVLSV